MGSARSLSRYSSRGICFYGEHFDLFLMQPTRRVKTLTGKLFLFIVILALILADICECDRSSLVFETQERRKLIKTPLSVGCNLAIVACAYHVQQIHSPSKNLTCWYPAAYHLSFVDFDHIKVWLITWSLTGVVPDIITTVTLLGYLVCFMRGPIIERFWKIISFSNSTRNDRDSPKQTMS